MSLDFLEDCSKHLSKHHFHIQTDVIQQQLVDFRVGAYLIKGVS